jgi:hypothetical protein
MNLIKKKALAVKQKTSDLVSQAWAKAAVATLLATAGASAHAGPFDDIMDAIDLGSVATKIVAMGVIVVGVYLAMQGISVAKRVISKV